MTFDRKLIGAVALLVLVAFGFGRWSAPEKIKIEKETSSVAAESSETKTDSRTDTDRDRHREIVVTERVNPDGSKEKTSRTVEDTATRRTSDVDAVRSDSATRSDSSRESKVVESGRSKVTLGVLAGVRVTDVAAGFKYGAHVQKAFLGPITLGVWGFTSGEAGLSLGITF